MARIKAYATVTFPIEFEDDGEMVLADQAHEAALERVSGISHEIEDVKITIEEQSNE